MNAEIRQAIATFAVGLAVVIAPECSAEPPERRLPRLLIDSSARDATELSWHNGETLKGEPAGMEEDHFQWKSALFTEVMSLRHEAVSRVDLAGNPSSPQGAFRFVFVDGSHLTGMLKSIEGEAVSLSSASCGDTVVRRDQLVAIERIRGPGIVAAGPASWLAGKSTATGRFANASMYQGAAGRVVFLEFNGGVRQELELPEKCLIKLRLRIEGDEPAFSLELASNKQSVTLETWDDELVLVQGEIFASAGAVSASDAGLLDLQLGWDLAAGTCVLFDGNGKSKAELALSKPEPVKKVKSGFSFGAVLPFVGEAVDELLDDAGVRSRPQQQQQAVRPSGITLTNRGAGFVIERYGAARRPRQRWKLPPASRPLRNSSPVSRLPATAPA